MLQKPAPNALGRQVNKEPIEDQPSKGQTFLGVVMQRVGEKTLLSSKRGKRTMLNLGTCIPFKQHDFLPA